MLNRARVSGVSLMSVLALYASAADAELPTYSAAAVAPAGAELPIGQPGVPPVSPEKSSAGSASAPKVFSEMLENVVVSTRKRDETLEETPLSITAISENSIKRLGARRIEDISDAVPNLEYGRTVGFTASRVNVRGVGQTDPIGTADPGVGVYVDGVFLPRAQAGLFATSDFDRVEIVRGPQGTIFGKNTIGGAINVITRQPSMDLGGSAEVRIGNFDLLETRGTLNVPLVNERLALRLSGATATRDGFEKERLGGTDPDDENLYAARAQLRWLPSENLEITLSGDTSSERRVLNQGKCVPINGGMQGFERINPLVGFTQACADVASSDNPRRVETDISFLRDDLRTYGGSARITWDAGQSTIVRSISSIRGLQSQNFNDFDATGIELIRPAVDDVGFEQSQFSQEFQLSSTALGGRLDYLVGLYAFKESSDDQLREGVLSTVTGADIVMPIPGLSADMTADAIRGAQIKTRNKVDNLSYAAFGQASYALTDRLKATAGLRFTEDRRRLFRRGIALTPGLDTAGRPAQAGDLTTFFDRTERFDDFTPSLSLGYELQGGGIVYASYSTGFKSGGFNGRAFPQVGDNRFPVDVDPEHLTTYEVGFKANFADRRVALNAAAFYSIYKDIQLTVLSGDPAINNVQIQLLNAGEAIISGGELELVFVPIANLQIRSALGLLHDRFTSFDDPSDARATDRHLQFLSNYQTSNSIEYSLALLDLGTLTGRASWSTRSREFLDVVNSDSLESAKRGLLDARLSLQLRDGVTELALFGSNLLDREYLVSGVDFSDTFGNASRMVGPPRLVGLELRRTF